MTLAEEIEQLKKLPGLHPDTITLLNRAAAAAKPKTTTTMTTAEEIHAAAVKNVEGNTAAAIVHILNVLRRLPPHIFVTRGEEAQAAQAKAEIRQQAETAGFILPQPLAEISDAVKQRLAEADAHHQAEMVGTTPRAAKPVLGEPEYIAAVAGVEYRTPLDPPSAKAEIIPTWGPSAGVVAAEWENGTRPIKPPATEGEGSMTGPADFCPATQWKFPHHYFTDSSGKAWCANCRQPQPVKEQKRIVWSASPNDPARWRGYLNGTTICLFLIDRNPCGDFGMGGGIIPDGEDWDGPNDHQTMEELQARAEQYVAEFQALLTR